MALIVIVDGVAELLDDGLEEDLIAVAKKLGARPEQVGSQILQVQIQQLAEKFDIPCKGTQDSEWEEGYCCDA